MADWSASKDRRAFAFAVLLLGGILLPAVCCTEDLGQWWLDPCDKLRKVRHEGSQEVHTQLKNVISSLRHVNEDLGRIFKGRIPKSHPVPKHSWLNNAKFKKEMKKQKNKDNALAVFHRALQLYGGTIFTLNETEIESKAYNAELSSQFLSGISYEMKRLTCEVSNELYEKNINATVLNLEDMNIKLHRKMDLTQAAIEYHDVMTKYRKFLNQSRRILFGKNADKGKNKGSKKNNKKAKTRKNKNVK